MKNSLGKCKYCGADFIVGELPDDEKIFDTCMNLPYTETHYCECNCGRSTGSSIGHAHSILLASLDHDNSSEFLLNEAIAYFNEVEYDRLLSKEIYILKARCAKEKEVYEIILKLGDYFETSAIQIIDHRNDKSHVFNFKDLTPVCKEFLDAIFVLAEQKKDK